MNSSLPLPAVSALDPWKVAAHVATIYLGLVLAAAWWDRAASDGTTWTTLGSIRTWLVTFPASFVADRLGLRPNYRDHFLHVLAAGIPCTLLVHLLTAGTLRAGAALFRAVCDR